MIVSILFNGLLQGAAIVAIAFLAARCVPERNAATRYALWFAALLALLVVPVLTVVSNVGAQLVAALRPLGGGHGITISLLPVGTLTHDATRLAASATTWIVAFWLAGVLVAGSRLVVSFIRIERIRRNATPIDLYGQRVLVSTDIAIPVAGGLFQPAVILPKTVVETLASSDLARVVAHERAHIRRNDLAGNLIQRCIEAMLFFNPWVYVIGRHLVDERESACDDRAVALTGEATDYAQCLATLAQGANHRRDVLLTPSALGSRNSVIARIERLIRNGASGVTSLNYYAIGGTIVLFAILTLALQAFSPAAAAPAYAPAASLSSGSTLVASACTKPNDFAKVVNPAMPQIPDSAGKAQGYVNVLVTIEPNGSVGNARLQHSSGNQQVDAAVFNAAKTSTYSPALHNCVPVAGTYVFNAKFDPNQ
jgi:TonB family protein